MTYVVRKSNYIEFNYVEFFKTVTNKHTKEQSELYLCLQIPHAVQMLFYIYTWILLFFWELTWLPRKTNPETNHAFDNFEFIAFRNTSKSYTRIYFYIPLTTATQWLLQESDLTSPNSIYYKTNKSIQSENKWSKRKDTSKNPQVIVRFTCF